MHEYISYEEAIELIDPEKVKAMNRPMTVTKLIDEGISVGEIFTVLHQGSIFIDKDSLLFSAQRAIKDSEKDKPRIEAYTKRTGYLLEHHCALERISSGELEGDVVIDGILCDYKLHMQSLASSLKEDGVYGILNGICGSIECCGCYVQVMNLPRDTIAWIAVYGRVCGGHSDGLLQGLPQRTIVGTLPGFDGQVHIALPIWFSKTELQELIRESKEKSLTFPV